MNERINDVVQVKIQQPIQAAPAVPERPCDDDHILNKVWALAPTTDQIKSLARIYYGKFRTPGYIWNDEQDYYHTLQAHVPSELCCTLLKDAEPVVLPSLEPIDDWSWLEHMGLRE